MCIRDSVESAEIQASLNRRTENNSQVEHALVLPRSEHYGALVSRGLTQNQQVDTTAQHMQTVTQGTTSTAHMQSPLNPIRNYDGLYAYGTRFYGTFPDLTEIPKRIY